MLGVTESAGSYEDFRDRALGLISTLENWGVRVSPYGRLREYAKQLSWFCDALQYGKRGLNLERIHRALLEVADLSLIVERLGNDPSTGFMDILAKSMSGGITHDDEKRQSPARDAQFELLLAAFFHRAGYAVELAEPDVQVQTPHLT